MTTLATVRTQHLVACYAMAARLNTGNDTLAARMAAIRAAVGK